MPIPALMEDGLLPEGLHQTTVEEVAARFGDPAWVTDGNRQRLSLQRRRLTEAFRTYVRRLQQAGIGVRVVVNGSYVTSNPEPNDVDVFVVHGPSYDPDQPVSLAERRLLDNRRTMEEYGVNVFDGPETSLRYQLVIAKWREVRGAPGKVKGMVWIQL